MESELEITNDAPASEPVDSAVAEPEPSPAPAPEPPKTTNAGRQPSPKGQTVSGGDRDEVRLASCVFKNTFARKTLSVYHVQRRLNELGYKDAYTDKSGWYGDLTMKAVREYQAANGLAGDGVIDQATLDHLFSDDPNVIVL